MDAFSSMTHTHAARIPHPADTMNHEVWLSGEGDRGCVTNGEQYHASAHFELVCWIDVDDQRHLDKLVFEGKQCPTICMSVVVGRGGESTPVCRFP